MTLSAISTTAETTAAETRGITKVYGEGAHAVSALDGVSVRFPTGSFTAVMGPSGSGKSTLMHAVAGLDTVDAGRILLAGKDLTAMTENERTLLRREQVGFVFQSYNLIPALTAVENITLPLDLAGKRPDPQWLEEVVKTLSLQDRLGHLPSRLSGGQQQRVAVARALVTRPALVLADEPTGNLDSAAGAQLLRLLRDAVSRLGQTVVMVTHDPAAASHADRVVYLADGRIAGESILPTVDEILGRMREFSAGKGA